MFSFTKTSNNNILHADCIKKEFDDEGWSRFILNDSKGFTRAGIERINDSIRTYCWAILGSQSHTRTYILGTGTAFDAQKQFLANIEDAINSQVDLPSQIARYQNNLKHARSKVDFVYGIGLNMSPSSMELRSDSMQHYNNEIVIATNTQDLGLKNDINVNPVPPKQTQTFQGTPTKQSHPNLDYRRQITDYAKAHNLPQSWIGGCSAEPGGLTRWIEAA